MTESKGEKPFIVTNTSARAIHTCGLTLVPGKPAEIPPEHVPALKRAPAWRAKWIQEGVVNMPAPRVLDLEKLKEEDAIKLIGVETDLGTLTTWLDAEKRGPVLAAIEARVKAL